MGGNPSWCEGQGVRLPTARNRIPEGSFLPTIRTSTDSSQAYERTRSASARARIHTQRKKSRAPTRENPGPAVRASRRRRALACVSSRSGKKLIECAPRWGRVTDVPRAPTAIWYAEDVWLVLALPLLAGDLYTYTAPDGTVVLTDSPRHDGFELWWRDTVPGRTLPNGVPMPRLDRIANLDAYDDAFLAAAEANGLPAELLKAVAVTESRMNPAAVSPAGAQGIMQIIPATARALGLEDPFDAPASIRAGARYLARQVSSFGSYKLALAAYNAGPGAVRRHGGVPPYPETTTYVARVLGLYEHFRDTRPVSR